MNCCQCDRLRLLHQLQLLIAVPARRAAHALHARLPLIVNPALILFQPLAPRAWRLAVKELIVKAANLAPLPAAATKDVKSAVLAVLRLLLSLKPHAAMEPGQTAPLAVLSLWTRQMQLRTS